MYPSSFSTPAMDAFILDEGICTDGLPTAAALRMRTSMSAMGSVMLMIGFLHRYPKGLPGRLAHARHIAAHGRLAQLVAAQAELRVDGARAPGHRAAGGLAGRGRVARQLLQLDHRIHLLVVAGRLAGDDLLELLALAGVLGRQLLALGLAVDH